MVSTVVSQGARDASGNEHVVTSQSVDQAEAAFAGECAGCVI